MSLPPQSHPPQNSWSLGSLLVSSRLSNLPSLHPQVHSLSLKLNLLSNNSNLLNSLIISYSHFNSPQIAHSILTHSQLHNPIISWTILLKHSTPAHALHLFDEMLHSNFDPDSILLLTMAKICGQLKSIPNARKLTRIAERYRFLPGDVLVENSIIKMWVECGRMEEARRVFDGMRTKDLIGWTTVINGCVRNGEFNEGLKLLRAMCKRGESMDAYLASAVLPACARMAAGKNGKEVHGRIIRLRLGANLAALDNALMDMYVKSGSMEYSLKIFERIPRRDVISWTVMIMGCSLHGQGGAGVELFREMTRKGRVLPDKTTYAAALHAANTACLVEEGKWVFSLIASPEPEHCVLMAGLLARGGYFIDAREFVEKHGLMRYPPANRAVLDGCRIQRNVKMGKRIAEQLVQLEPLNAENYVLLSNVYAANGKWEFCEQLREAIVDMGLKAKKAYSWIEIRNKIHVFGTGDVSHPRSEAIYWELNRLMKRMREEEEEGDVAREDFSLHDVDEERECVPCGHSEMLAIGLGLISGSQRTRVLRVTKNLRVCGNCHDSAKLIAKIVDLEIILKDPDRFHHFKNGVCSCSDMW